MQYPVSSAIRHTFYCLCFSRQCRNGTAQTHLQLQVPLRTIMSKFSLPPLTKPINKHLIPACKHLARFLYSLQTLVMNGWMNEWMKHVLWKIHIERPSKKWQDSWHKWLFIYAGINIWHKTDRRADFCVLP